MQIDRTSPGLDVIIFDIEQKDVFKKTDSLEIDEVIFYNQNRIEDKIGYIKYMKMNDRVRFFYKTTRFINYTDSVLIKNTFKKESIKMILKDKSDLKIENCEY